MTRAALSLPRDAQIRTSVSKIISTFASESCSRCGFDSLREEANPPIDLPQPPLAVLIVGVFSAIAVAGSPRDDGRDGGTFPGE